MISGISTVCFTASYAMALVLELARLFSRSGWRTALAVAFVAVGWIAQTLFLGYRAATAPVIPLSSAQDWYLVAAWLLVAGHLYFTFFHPNLAQGAFVLPLVLALIAAARFANPAPFAQSPAIQIWGAIHGTFWLLGAVAVIVGFVSGAMYLLQARRLKSKLPPRGLRLPSLEWLERVNGRAIVISVLMAGIGTLSGYVLNLVNHRYRQDELPWNDPIIWQSTGMFAWLLIAALFNAFYKPARQGRKVAYLTVASFVFLAIFLLSQLFGAGEHSRKGPARPVAVSLMELTDARGRLA
jgi:ABC-type transport system involved in cytochrome c biogenesis permease subunit